MSFCAAEQEVLVFGVHTVTLDDASCHQFLGTKLGTPESPSPAQMTSTET